MNPFLKDLKLVSASVYLLVLLTLGVLAPFIANEGKIIPFGPTDVSRTVFIYEPPGTNEVNKDGEKLTHYFGTDNIGQDVASRLIHGIAVAFKVGVWSSIVALLIALILGGLSGYKGDKTDQITLLQGVWLIIGFLLCHFYAKEGAYYSDAEGVFKFYFSTYFLYLLFGIVLLLIVCKLLSKVQSRKIWIQWDLLVTKLIEVFNSIPRLFLLLAIFAIITRPSLWSVILIIGFIRWPSLTRLIRAEIINVKQEDYIKNASILGLPSWKILVHHILPNIYKSILILTALNMGTAILIESSLSFLQIGLPIDQVSWGRMLGESRDYIPAWWLAVGPGLLIFSMILSFNVIGDRLSYHFGVDNNEF